MDLVITWALSTASLIPACLTAHLSGPSSSWERLSGSSNANICSKSLERLGKGRQNPKANPSVSSYGGRLGN